MADEPNIIVNDQRSVAIETASLQCISVANVRPQLAVSSNPHASANGQSARGVENDVLPKPTTVSDMTGFIPCDKRVVVDNCIVSNNQLINERTGIVANEHVVAKHYSFGVLRGSSLNQNPIFNNDILAHDDLVCK